MKFVRISLPAIFVAIVMISIAMAWFVDRSRLKRTLENERATRDPSGCWVLRCTVLDNKSGQPVHGWKVKMNHGLGGYSGPPLAEHFGQTFDVDGVFYICAVPSTDPNDSYPERLGIEISRDIKGSQYRASFLILGDMWRDGRWKTPKLNHGYPGEEASPAPFRLKLECVSEPSTKLGSIN